MQNFTVMAASDTMTESLPNIVNNFETILSNNSGSVHPSVNILPGRTSFRTDEDKLYQRNAAGDAWILIADLSGQATTKEYVDDQISTHDHDSAYSASDHNHTGVYSAVSHNHDAVYATLSHGHPVTDISGVVKTVGNSTIDGDLTMDGTHSIYLGAAMGRVYHDATNLKLQNLAHGGKIYLQAENAVGTLATMMYADPDNYCYLYYAGAWKLRTLTDGVEVNGAMKSDTFEIMGKGKIMQAMTTATYNATSSKSGNVLYCLTD